MAESVLASEAGFGAKMLFAVGCGVVAFSGSDAADVVAVVPNREPNG